VRGRFDLHLHTTASDGLLAPEEVVRRAAEAGLVCIAVTDHDTCAGVAHAREEGRKLGLPVVAGAEFSAEHAGELHILGYGMAMLSPAWEAFSTEQRGRRAERNTLMLDRIEALGLDIPEEYRPWNVPGEYGRMHMALGLVAAGFASDVQDAFDRYLGISAPAHVRRRKFTAGEIISAVKAAEGFAVLAHPGRMGLAPERMAGLVSELKEQGLFGVEAFYPSHSREEAAYYTELADGLGLVCTYGSDWHGHDRSGLAYGFHDFEIPESTYEWLDLISDMGGCP
jgi:predicted metal-dependent phosphoesterase TrpH